MSKQIKQTGTPLPAPAGQEVAYIGQATVDQIAKWKELHKDVYVITVENHVCYVRAFDRKTMSYALSQLSFSVDINQKNKIDMNMGRLFSIGDAGLTNLWLGGSAEIKTDTRLYAAAAMAVGELFDFAEATIKKL
ncbi:MAG: hypothetical protein PHU33_16495 [Bacteroidales bacterium]|nr:hypothetical protein [Bacteroidales bacterium]